MEKRGKGGNVNKINTVDAARLFPKHNLHYGIYIRRCAADTRTTESVLLFAKHVCWLSECLYLTLSGAQIKTFDARQRITSWPPPPISNCRSLSLSWPKWRWLFLAFLHFNGHILAAGQGLIRPGNVEWDVLNDFIAVRRCFLPTFL